MLYWEYIHSAALYYYYKILWRHTKPCIKLKSTYRPTSMYNFKSHHLPSISLPPSTSSVAMETSLSRTLPHLSRVFRSTLLSQYSRYQRSRFLRSISYSKTGWVFGLQRDDLLHTFSFVLQTLYFFSRTLLPYGLISTFCLFSM